MDHVKLAEDLLYKIYNNESDLISSINNKDTTKLYLQLALIHSILAKVRSTDSIFVGSCPSTIKDKDFTYICNLKEGHTGRLHQGGLGTNDTFARWSEDGLICNR